jgi:hypothetical protein
MTGGSADAERALEQVLVEALVDSTTNSSLLWVWVSMKPAVTTWPLASMVSTPSILPSVIIAILPSLVPTSGFASNPVSTSKTRPLLITTSYSAEHAAEKKLQATSSSFPRRLQRQSVLTMNATGSETEHMAAARTFAAANRSPEAGLLQPVVPNGCSEMRYRRDRAASAS